MAKVNFELKGADKLIKKLSKYGAKAIEEVDMETQATAFEIQNDAKQNLVGRAWDTGATAQQIFVAQPINAKGKVVYTVVSNTRYSPYIEFGTGGLVKVPPELYQLAIKFKGKGIREVNLPARPFLYPAFLKNKPKYINRLEQMLKRYGEDISR